MFCHQCGNQIQDGDRFCENCGAEVLAAKRKNERGNDRKKKDNNRKKKKTGLIITVAVLIFVAVATVITVTSILRNKERAEQSITGVNNYQNGGRVVSDGTWIYYIDSENRLMKNRLKDGKNESVIATENVPEKMFLLGNTLYYYRFPGIFKSPANKWKEEDLGFNVFAKDCFQTDGNRYYISGMGSDNGKGVFAFSQKNLKDGVCISKVEPQILLIYKNYIYIINGYETIDNGVNETQGTWRIDKNGADETFLMYTTPEYMVFSDDEIFYTDDESCVCSMDLEGDNQHVFKNAKVYGGLNVSKDYVFYLDGTNTDNRFSLHRMNKDGSNDTILTHDECSDLSVVGEWIFYVNESNGFQLYRMNFDGSYNAPISVPVDDRLFSKDSSEKNDKKTPSSDSEKGDKDSKNEMPNEATEQIQNGVEEKHDSDQDSNNSNSELKAVLSQIQGTWSGPAAGSEMVIENNTLNLCYYTTPSWELVGKETYAITVEKTDLNDEYIIVAINNENFEQKLFHYSLSDSGRIYEEYEFDGKNSLLWYNRKK